MSNRQQLGQKCCNWVGLICDDGLVCEDGKCKEKGKHRKQINFHYLFPPFFRVSETIVCGDDLARLHESMTALNSTFTVQCCNEGIRDREINECISVLIVLPLLDPGEGGGGDSTPFRNSLNSAE